MSLLGKLLDPRGPLGNVLAPSETFKERAGLPVAAPHSVRVRAVTAAPAHAIAVSRFVAYGAETPPPGRTRFVGRFAEEWKPVYATTDSTDPYDIVAAAQRQLGWTVTRTLRTDSCDCTGTVLWDRDDDGTVFHQFCGRPVRNRLAGLTAEEAREQLLSLSIQRSDAWANVYATTIPGNDTGVVDGVEVKGGTQLRGRADYRRKTKGWVHWDKGVVAERAAADERAAATKKMDNRIALKKLAAKILPSRGNLSPTERT